MIYQEHFLQILIAQLQTKNLKNFDEIQLYDSWFRFRVNSKDANKMMTEIKILTVHLLLVLILQCNLRF